MSIPSTSPCLQRLITIKYLEKYIRKSEGIMSDVKLANPAALGLGGFALTTFILNIVNTGLISRENLGMVLPVGIFYGGLAQFCAGMWEFKRGDTFGATCFSSFGAFWMSVAVMIILENTGVISHVRVRGWQYCSSPGASSPPMPR
jgi:succinate-acetate transporter protein